jgi:hypothetical protein
LIVVHGWPEVNVSVYFDDKIVDQYQLGDTHESDSMCDIQYMQYGYVILYGNNIFWLKDDVVYILWNEQDITLYSIDKESKSTIIALGERGITSDEKCVVQLSIDTDKKIITNCVLVKNSVYSIPMIYEEKPYIAYSDINGNVWIYSPTTNALFDLNKLNRDAPKPSPENRILERMFTMDKLPDIFIIEDSSFNQFIVKMDFDDYSTFKPEITSITSVFTFKCRAKWQLVSQGGVLNSLLYDFLTLLKLIRMYIVLTLGC